MRHIALEGRCYVIGVNPCLRTDQILAGPARHEETILYAEVDLAAVHAARRFFDPVGHYGRPDVFQLLVDIRPRPLVVERHPTDSQGLAERTRQSPSAPLD